MPLRAPDFQFARVRQRGPGDAALAYLEAAQAEHRMGMDALGAIMQGADIALRERRGQRELDLREAELGEMGNLRESQAQGATLAAMEKGEAERRKAAEDEEKQAFDRTKEILALAGGPGGRQAAGALARAGGATVTEVPRETAQVSQEYVSDELGPVAMEMLGLGPSPVEQALAITDATSAGLAASLAGSGLGPPAPQRLEFEEPPAEPIDIPLGPGALQIAFGGGPPITIDPEAIGREKEEAGQKARAADLQRVSDTLAAVPADSDLGKLRGDILSRVAAGQTVDQAISGAAAGRVSERDRFQAAQALKRSYVLASSQQKRVESAPTGPAERRTLGFANRMSNQLDIITATGDMAETDAKILRERAALEGAIGERGTNALIASGRMKPVTASLSPRGRKLYYAARAFAGANLRRESGAAISIREIVDELEGMTRQVGDTDEDYRRKMATARDKVDSAYLEAGVDPTTGARDVAGASGRTPHPGRSWLDALRHEAAEVAD